MVLTVTVHHEGTKIHEDPEHFNFIFFVLFVVLRSS